MLNERSAALIYEKTQETFQQRLINLRGSIFSYWESEKDNLLNNAILYAESEKIVNYSVYGLFNLLQKEANRLVAKTGFHDMEIQLRNGQIVSSLFEGNRKNPMFDPDDAELNLAKIVVQQEDFGVYLRAEVPIHKMGEFVGRLSLRRKLDDTRLKKMSRNLQAEVSLAVKEGIIASSLERSALKDLITEHYQNNDRKEDIFKLKLNGRIYSIGRVFLGRTELGDPIMTYVAISQAKMLSLVEEARYRNLNTTGWALIISLVFSIIFSETVLLSRIRKVRDGANVISEGDLSFRLIEGIGDELGDLAKTFNNMAHNLNKNQNELRETIDKAEKLANYIQNILGSLTTCVITWTIDGKIETVNPAAIAELKELYGQLKGISFRTFLKRIKPKSRQAMIKAFRELKNDQTNLQFDVEFELNENSGIKVMQAGFSYLKDFEDKPYGIVLTLSDITKRKIIEQQLYHADKLSSIGQLAASVAHEIKNPLASIKTLGQLLQEETSEGEDSREYVDVIVSEVNRLNGVVEQLLKYAKPEGSSFKMISFAKVIEPVLALVNHESGRHQVKIETSYSQDLMLFVDSEKIKQVFLNLIFNAIQAMKNGGVIKVQAFMREDSPWTCLEVEDNGPGMPFEITEKVFDPFFTTKQRGTGLGLAIVKKIIDLHGGKIELNSSPDKGTKVTILLPRS